MSKALFIVDVQNDFTEGGALAVEGGDAVAERISRFLSEHADDYSVIIASRDWHDGDNDNGGHFAAGVPDFVDTWPAHCVSGTEGAEYDTGLQTDAVTHHVKKGQGRPAYSLFEGTTEAGETVGGLLDAHGVIDVDVSGLATDYCVRASALDAIEHGRRVRVLTDLVAGVAPDSSEAARPSSPTPGPSSRSRVSEPTAPGTTAPEPTAQGVRAALEAAASVDDRVKIQHRMTDDVTEVIGVRMGTVFDIAKENTRMPLPEVDRLLHSDVYELKMVGVSILDFKARTRGLGDDDRRAIYELWMRNLDRIDTWDYIDRSAPRVVGWYLLDKPRAVLFELARSQNRWHRRAAITAAFWIIRARDLDDPLALCELLAADPEHLVQTNVGVALREIGRVDRAVLEDFLARRGELLSAHARRTARSAL